jgi:hypothetical protein
VVDDARGDMVGEPLQRAQTAGVLVRENRLGL